MGAEVACFSPVALSVSLSGGGWRRLRRLVVLRFQCQLPAASLVRLPLSLALSRSLLSLLPFALVARCCSISLVVAISSPLSRSPSSRAFARGYLGCSREVSQERQSARVLASAKIDLSRATKRQLPREILAPPPPPTGRHRHTHPATLAKMVQYEFVAERYATAASAQCIWNAAAASAPRRSDAQQ